ncbi:beta propeller repeat protein [Spiroplasma melliferum]|uniref:Membrane protein n=2 Tax=Spiroplasma melliferum TaxID=2134 RepID=A0AAI9X1A1_SPIME|nr:hypothetical protein [Spiroplasma melliferum]KAI92725.1 membrane protein [Spiroplasma melliferum KC3]QCO24338.1 hypothetical protein SRED_002832 [Spiroplasma melliferum]
MKKLLSVLTMSTAIFNGISAITAVRFNNEVSTNFINNENKYAKLIKINKETVQFIAFDDKGNSFMGTKNELYHLKYKKTKKQKINGINELTKTITFYKNITYIGTKKGAYILNNGETTVTKINNINNIKINTINVINNNVYFGTDDGAYILKNGETTATKINNFNFFTNHELKIDNNKIYACSYIGNYKFIDGETTAIKISGLDLVSVHLLEIAENHNVYFATNRGLYVLKHGETTAVKINNVNENVWTIKIINNDVYFGTDFGAYVLKDGATNPKQINEVRGKISLIATANNELYLAGENDMIYHLKNKEINTIELNTITEKGIRKIYFDKMNDNIYIQQYFNDIYLLIDKNKIMKDEIFEKWYKFLAPDILKVKLSFYQVEEIVNKFEKKQKPDFMAWLNTTIKNIPEADHSGAGGSITNDNIKIISNLIYEHYSDFHTKYQQMRENDELVLSTTTNGYWDESDLYIIRNL